MRTSIAIVLSFLLSGAVSAQTLNLSEVDNSTYTGKAMFGYQGWFGHPNDKSPRPNFWHWGNMYERSMDALSVESFPDMREMGLDESYPTAYTFPNGNIAKVFSSGNRKTVHRHMKWVRDYNTDGVWVQRFISESGDKVVMAFRDSTTVFVQEGCEQYGRVFAIMYDGIANRVDDIKEDWMHLVDDLEITESDRYLNHEGRPIVALWGYTVRDDATVDQLEELIDWFHNTADEKYRASIKLGVNDNWFNKDQAWQDALAKVEVISPWSVGRFGDASGYSNYVKNQIVPSLAWCNDHDILYVPVLFPGFSWNNLKDGDTKNKIPREGGNFFWMQAYGAMLKNVESLYFAMFDELDESTAMFKIAETDAQSPAQEYWLSLDADGFDLPSDWFLRCAGQASEALRGNISLSGSLGTPDEGILTIRPSCKNNCTMVLLFPDFDNETTLEVSIDGGATYPYSFSDDIGSYDIGDIGEGNYTVFVRHPGSAAVPMGDVYLSSCYATSIDNSISEIEIKMYPNPTSSILFVDGLEGHSQIDIVDILGKTCKSVIVQGSSTRIDMTDFPKALYFVKVRIGSESFMRKITKM